MTGLGNTHVSDRKHLIYWLSFSPINIYRFRKLGLLLYTIFSKPLPPRNSSVKKINGEKQGYEDKISGNKSCFYRTTLDTQITDG